MSLTRMGGENEADTHSIDGAWTAGNLSKAKLHQQGPGSKRKRSNDPNSLISGVPTTKHRIYQRTQRIGDRGKQYDKLPIVGARVQGDDPGDWLDDEEKWLNQDTRKGNHLLQRTKDLNSTELQSTPTKFGLETAESLKKLEKIYINFTHCIIYYIHCTKGGKKNMTVGYRDSVSIHSVRIVCENSIKYRRSDCRKPIQKQDHHCRPIQAQSEYKKMTSGQTIGDYRQYLISKEHTRKTTTRRMMNSEINAESVESKIQRQLVHKTRICETEVVTILAMPQPDDLEDLFEQLNENGIRLLTDVKDSIVMEAKRQRAGGQHPFAMFAADTASNHGAERIDVRLPCEPISFMAAENYREIIIHCQHSPTKPLNRRDERSSGKPDLRQNKEQGGRGRGRGPRVMTTVVFMETESGEEQRKLVHETQLLLKVFYDLDQLVGGGTLECEKSEFKWIRALKFDSLPMTAIEYPGDIRLAIGTTIADTLGSLMASKRGQWEFDIQQPRPESQWVRYWYQHTRVDLKREFHPEKREYVMVGYVSIALAPDTQAWEADLANRLLDLLPVMNGLNPGQPGAPWPTALRNSVITKCEAYVVRALLTENQNPRPVTVIKAPHMYTRVSIQAVPRDMTPEAYFQAVITALRSPAVGIHPLFVGLNAGEQVGGVTMYVDIEQPDPIDTRRVNEILMEMAQLSGGVRARIMDVRLVKVAGKPAKRAPKKVTATGWAREHLNNSASTSEPMDDKTYLNEPGENDTGRKAAASVTPTEFDNPNPRKRPSIGEAEDEDDEPFLELIPDSNGGAIINTNLYDEVGELTEIKHACAIETYLRLCRLPSETREQQIHRMLLQIQTGTGSLTVKESEAQLAALGSLLAGEQDTLDSTAELTIFGIVEAAQRKFVAAYQISSKRIQIRTVSPQKSTEQGFALHRLTDGVIVPLFGPEGHVTLAKLRIGSGNLTRICQMYAENRQIGESEVYISNKVPSAFCKLMFGMKKQKNPDTDTSSGSPRRKRGTLRMPPAPVLDHQPITRKRGRPSREPHTAARVIGINSSPEVAGTPELCTGSVQPNCSSGIPRPIGESGGTSFTVKLDAFELHMKSIAPQFTPPSIRWNLVGDKNTCYAVKEAIGVDSTTPCSSIVHRFSASADWMPGAFPLSDRLEQQLDANRGRYECVIVLRTNPSEISGIPVSQDQWEQSDVLKVARRALIIDYSPVWLGIPPSGLKPIETIGILRTDHPTSVIIPIIKHYLEQVELQVMLAWVRTNNLLRNHHLALAMAHKTRAQEDEWVLEGGRTLEWLYTSVHQAYFEAEWVEFMYQEGVADERIYAHADRIQTQIKALRVLFLPELTLWKARMVLFRSRDRHINHTRTNDYLVDMDDLPYPPPGHEVPITERGIALSTSLGSHILHGEAIVEKINAMDARLEQIHADLPFGHINRTPPVADTGIKLAEHTVHILPDSSLGAHDCGVSCLVELTRLRGIAQGNEQRHLIQCAEAAGEPRLAKAIARHHRLLELRRIDRPTLGEMAAVVGPLLYVIRTWDGWKLFAITGTDNGARPVLTVQYSTPILIADYGNQHLTVGLLTIGPDDLEARQTGNQSMITEIIPGREDNTRYGMRGFTSPADTVKVKESVKLMIGPSNFSPENHQHRDRSDKSEGTSSGGLEQMQAGSSKPEADEKLAGPIAGTLDRVLPVHLITPTLYIRTADPLLNSSVTSTNSKQHQARVTPAVLYAQNDFKGELVGRSGGLTIKATKLMQKQPGIRDALADPLRTAEKLSLAIQASTEPGLLIGIPYNQPATRSVAADGWCGLHAFGQYTLALSTLGELRNCKHSQPLHELHQVLSTVGKVSGSEPILEAYRRFLQSTLALIQSNEAMEATRIRMVLGDHYDLAIGDVRKLLQMLLASRVHNSPVVGLEYWQKGYVLTLLSAANHIPFELFGPYTEISGQLEDRRLRVEQRSDGVTSSIDNTMTVSQIISLLQRGQGGVGLVDNHFYLIGPLRHLLGEVTPAIMHLATRLIQLELRGGPARRENPIERTTLIRWISQ